MSSAAWINRARCITAVAVAAAVLSGCGSRTSAGRTQIPATSAATVAASTDPPPATTTSPAVPASATGIATDPQGDAVTVLITVGSPTPASDIQNPAVLGCADDLTSDGSSLDRSIAVPVTAQVKLTTSSPVEFQLELNFVASVQHGAANLDKTIYATPATAPFWAMAFSTGPLCSSESPTGGHVHWNSLVPGIPTTFSAWMILAEQNTPASPGLDYLDSFPNTLLLEPDVYLGTGGIEQLGFSGASVVDCASENFIAVNPSEPNPKDAPDMPADLTTQPICTFGPAHRHRTESRHAASANGRDHRG